MSNHEHEHCGCGCEHHDHKPVADKYMTAINQSNVTTDDAAVAAAVQEIIDKHAAENNTTEVQQFLLNCVDLTTLATEDSERSVAQFVQRSTTLTTTIRSTRTWPPSACTATLPPWCAARSR